MGPAHAHEVGRVAEQLHVARVPGHEVQVGVDDDHALRQVLQAAREAGVRLLGGLHDAVLRGAQLLRVLAQHGLQLLAAALAQGGQALALAHEQRQQEERQPAAGAGGRGPAAVGHAALRCVHQVQLPGRAGQRLALPQHAAGQGGGQHADEPAAVVHAVRHAVFQRAQRLVGVLPRGGELAAPLVVQRLQQAVAPRVLAGQEDHAVRVGREHDVRRPAATRAPAPAARS
ncbi:putative transcriptional regulator [Alicycliphilus sp. B1]|nr:putative transcriptional regulator [Alicycliphilus sp. B1]